MKTWTKKTLALILTLTMLVGSFVISGTGYAAEIIESGECGAEGNNVTWTLDSDGLLTISGTGDMFDAVYETSPFLRTPINKCVIEYGVTSIGDMAFRECPMTSIVIPNSVTRIGAQSFFRCEELTSVLIPASVVDICGSSFWGCSELACLEVEQGNPKYHSSGNCIIETENKTLIKGCKNSIIPCDGSVTSIDIHAFVSNKGVESVEIPNGVTSIGEYVFGDCYSLTSIVIADSVTDIGGLALANCTKLKTVKLSQNIKSISGALLSNCYDLTVVTIPKNVSTIENYAFSGCKSLSSVILPEKITDIGENAFLNCPELKDIYYGGNETQWAQISIASGNDALTNVTIHFNYADLSDVCEHFYFVIANACAATCTTDGYTGDTVCRDCGETLETGTVIPALEHNWGEWTVTKDAKCEETGTKQRVCKRDGNHVETEKIPAKGHTPVTINGKAATCTENGLTDGVKCSECGKIITAQNVIPAGHKLVYVPAVKATSSKPGNIGYYKCYVCGKCFSDDSGKTEVSEESVVIPVTNPVVENRCPYCGKIHTGFLGAIVRFFHDIAYFFAHLFGKM